MDGLIRCSEFQREIDEFTSIAERRGYRRTAAASFCRLPEWLDASSQAEVSGTAYVLGVRPRTCVRSARMFEGAR